MNKKITSAALLILIGFSVISNYIFLERVDWFSDKDEAYHAGICADIFRSIANGEGFSEYLLDINWPRGYHLVSVAARAAFGDHFIFMTPTLFLILLLCITYKIGELFKNRTAGLLSALVVSLYPGIYVSSRHFDYELAQAAMAALVIYFLIRNERFIRPGYSLLFGLLLATGLLMKQSIIFFIAGPFIVASCYLLKPLPDNKIRIRNLSIALFLCFVLAFLGYYRIYFNHPEVLNQYGIQRFFIKDVHGAGNLGSNRISEILFYVTALRDFHIGIPGLILFFIGLPYFLFKNKKTRYKLFLAAWLGVSFCIFSIAAIKLPHYTIGYLPVFAVITAVGITYIRPKAVAVGLAAVFLGISFISYSCYTFKILPKVNNYLVSKKLSANWGPWGMTAARDTNPAYETAEYLSKIAGNKRTIFGLAYYLKTDPASPDTPWLAACLNSLVGLHSSKYEVIDLIDYANHSLIRKCDFFVCFSPVAGYNWLDYAVFSQRFQEGMKYAADFPYMMGKYHLVGDEDIAPSKIGSNRTYITPGLIKELADYFPNLTLLKEIKSGDIVVSIYKNNYMDKD